MQSPVLLKQRTLRIWLAIASFTALVAFYYYIYVTDDFSVEVTDLATVSMDTLAALIAAVISTLVWRRYGAATPSRRIWQFLALALWGWTLAEFIWLCGYAAFGSYLFGPADVFWVISYGFFTAALYRQYLLIYRPTRLRGVVTLAIPVILVLLVTFGFASWLARINGRALDVEVLVSAFYSVGDFALAAGALWLAIAFRDGALSRPWLGLLVFTLSDFLYAWLKISDIYARNLAQGNILTTFTDTAYFAAYLTIAFGCYLQWLLLSYGPRLKI